MDEAGGGTTTSYTHDGTTWHIPDDLIAVQRAWDQADRDVQQAAGDGDDSALNAARARRLDLTDELHQHPWLLDALAHGRRHQADLALKACARAQQ